MEDEKPPKPVLYKPQSLRKASEIIQSEPKGQKIRIVNDVNPSPRAGKDEMRCPSSTVRQETSGTPLSPAFVLLDRLNDGHPH